MVGRKKMKKYPASDLKMKIYSESLSREYIYIYIFWKIIYIGKKGKG